MQKTNVHPLKIRHGGAQKGQRQFDRHLYFIGLLVAALAVLLSGHAQAAQKPRHLVVFVHGIGGSEATFGEMPKIMVGTEEKPGHLAQVEPQYEWRSLSADYETGNDTFNVYNFAQNMGEKITKALGDRPFESDERITIVAHSQGGLISYIWYILSLTEPVEFFEKQRPYALAVDSIVTLGTPFWGSNLAVGARYYSPLLKFDGANEWINKIYGWASDSWKEKRHVGVELTKKLGMGEMQLKEMRPSSDTMFKFRRRAIEIDRSGFKYPMRPLNIAGVFPKSDSEKFEPEWRAGTERAWPSTFKRLKYKNSVKLAEQLLAGGDRLEADIAVLVSRARADFIYSEALGQKYADGYITPLQKTRRTKYLQGEDEKSLFKFIPLESYHANFFDPAVYDMVAVPAVCANPAKCDHASYRFVVEHILSTCRRDKTCDRAKYADLISKLFSKEHLKEYYNPKLKEELKTFSLDINVRLPLNYQVPRDIYDCQAFRLNCAGLENFVSAKPLFNSKDIKIVFGQSDIPASQMVQESFFSFKNEQMLNLRVYFNGHIDWPGGDLDKRPEFAKEGLPVEVGIQLPGLKRRFVQTRVRPMFTTFVDAQLEGTAVPYDSSIEDHDSGGTP